MSNIIKTLSLVKKINNLRKLYPVSNAQLTVSDFEIEINLNGIPSVIALEYDGAAIFSSSMPKFITSDIGNNTILISNLFKHIIPVKLYTYSGDIRITRCLITNYDGTQISATITNNQDLKKINKMKTNLENDDEILFDEPKIPTERKRGSFKPALQTSSKTLEFNIKSRVEKRELVNKIFSEAKKMPSYTRAVQKTSLKNLKAPIPKQKQKQVAKIERAQGIIKYERGKK